jgi:transposase
VRQLKLLPPQAVWLFEDETILRLFPVLRRAWSLRGEQAVVPITGNNAKRVLFGVLNPRTGHRIVVRDRNMRQESFRAFLRLLRHSYPGRAIWLLLDEAPCHIAPKSRALAATLQIRLVWLPKQCSELNAMDHLWRALKEKISANYQFENIDEHADFAENWLGSLSDHETLLKAGVLSKHFWLQSFLQ